LVEGLVDLASPPGLATSLANLTPWGRNVGDTSELGEQVVDGVIDPSWGVKWFRGEV
jgi:hypothetical protein